jgi:hypothetical protein
LTAGQCHDSPQAEALIAGYSTQAVIADKGYDNVRIASSYSPATSDKA